MRSVSFAAAPAGLALGPSAVQTQPPVTHRFVPAQFHVTRNGLSLLVAYVLHLIDVRHFTAPI